ncbi:helix-turn-helix domain-containing protein [Actinomadura macra]|uniref:helix-turn-helix domain-containing protein n=1 Tax=Actinomadura macra TaxID=46164 RepID=UPI000835CC88|nr:helix-turn-helix transcriptional regulator [Actinomadura macra]
MIPDRQIGHRIAATRVARRFTQVQLAEAACISLSTLRKVEQGKRSPGDRVLKSVAGALGVEPEVLAGHRICTDSRVHAAIPDIRSAIDAYDVPDDGPVRPLDRLREATEAATRYRLTAQYTRLAKELPPLLVELSRAVLDEGPGRRYPAGLLFSAYRSADAVAYKYGYYDLSARLIELMRRSAQISEDPALIATAAYVRTEVFFAGGRDLTSGLRALEIALDAIPDLASPDLWAAAGALHMRAAVVAARLTGDFTAVDDHLQEARRRAEDVPEGIYNGTAFGPASLQVHEVSVAVELGDPARAVQLAGGGGDAGQKIGLDGLLAERRSHYFIDLARARLWLGKRDGAFEALQTARRIAPQHVREHPFVRDALVTLLRLHMSPPHQLVAFADWARAI